MPIIFLLYHHFACVSTEIPAADKLLFGGQKTHKPTVGYWLPRGTGGRNGVRFGKSAGASRLEARHHLSVIGMKKKTEMLHCSISKMIAVNSFSWIQPACGSLVFVYQSILRHR